MDQEEDKDWMKNWGGDLYVAPEYVEGSHPMDRDGGVTWHHQWPKEKGEHHDTTGDIPEKLA